MRKVANLRRLLGMVVTAIKAGRSVYHTTMLGQPERRVKHKVCQFVRSYGRDVALSRFPEFQTIPVGPPEISRPYTSPTSGDSKR